MVYFMEKTNLEMDENWGYPHDKADTSKNEQSSKPDMWITMVSSWHQAWGPKVPKDGARNKSGLLTLW